FLRRSRLGQELAAPAAKRRRRRGWFVAVWRDRFHNTSPSGQTLLIRAVREKSQRLPLLLFEECPGLAPFFEVALLPPRRLAPIFSNFLPVFFLGFAVAAPSRFSVSSTSSSASSTVIASPPGCSVPVWVSMSPS